MMKNTILFFALVLVLALAAAGCSANDDLAVPTLTETIPPTKTLAPSETATLQPPTATITLEPASTLSTSIEKDQYLLDLIETNGVCEIPCLWGIEVGTSTWQDVRFIFDPMTALRASLVEGSKYLFHFYRGLFDCQCAAVFVEMSSYSYSNPIQFLSATYYISLEPGWENYNLIVKERFSLQKILEFHGLPSSVYLKPGVQYEQGGGIESKLVLVYQESGFAIEYNQSNKVSQELGNRPDYLFCFNDDWLESIKLSVVKAKGTLLYKAEIFSQIEEGYLKDFLDITELSIEDFNNIVLLGEQELCFELVEQ